MQHELIEFKKDTEKNTQLSEKLIINYKFPMENRFQ